MLDNKGFDLWADGYDKSVGLSEEENTYPFAGYKKVLGNIYKTIIPRNIRLAEAPSYGLPINKYDPKSTGAESYMRLADEVIEREE